MAIKNESDKEGGGRTDMHNAMENHQEAKSELTSPEEAMESWGGKVERERQ